MSDDRYPRIQFRAGELLGPLTARQDGERLSRDRVAARDLERYYAVLAAELRRLDLTRDEAMLVLDSLNGVLHETPESAATMLWASVSDSIELDGLDRKWGVDGAALITKLRALSVAGALALIDAAERWWVLAGAAQEGGGAVPAEEVDRLRVVGLMR